MREYNPNKIEKKWQDIWDEKEVYKTSIDKDKPKFYALVEFPYPSGEGLHVGHPRPYTALDVVARKRRYQGYNVLYPMGWDAFGLPTENYAIKHKIHPAKVTEYADRLIDDLELVNFIDRVKIQQTNWIGRSEGAELDFNISDKEDKLRVFTTRPDTIFGSTYMVIAVEHPLIDKYKDEISNYDEILEYRNIVSKKSDFERTELSKEKTGVELKGLKAINPATGKEIPIWISDYVLMTYGTGAIMAVPGHDQRDWEFAKKFNLPIVEVIKGGNIEKEAYTNTDQGILINSDFLDGMKVSPPNT